MSWLSAGYEGIGTDIAPEYSGAADGTAVVSMPYVSLDITDADAVRHYLRINRMLSFTALHGQLLIWLRMRTKRIRCTQSMRMVLQTSQRPARRLAARWFTSAPTMYLTVRVLLRWTQTARIITHLMSMVSLKSGGELAVSSTLDNYFYRAYRMGIWQEWKRTFIKTMVNVARHTVP